MMMLQTSFRLLHEMGACKDRYKYLAKSLGGIKKYGEDTPITLLKILDVCGLDDAIWAVRACPGAEQFGHLLACDYAEHVLHVYEHEHPGDYSPHNVIKTTRQYAKGEATKAEVEAMRRHLPTQASSIAVFEVLTAVKSSVHADLYSTVSAARDANEFAAIARIIRPEKNILPWKVIRDSVEQAINDEIEWQEQRLRELLEEVEE